MIHSIKKEYDESVKSSEVIEERLRVALNQREVLENNLAEKRVEKDQLEIERDETLALYSSVHSEYDSLKKEYGLRKDDFDISEIYETLVQGLLREIQHNLTSIALETAVDPNVYEVVDRLSEMTSETTLSDLRQAAIDRWHTDKKKSKDDSPF